MLIGNESTFGFNHLLKLLGHTVGKLTKLSIGYCFSGCFNYLAQGPGSKALDIIFNFDLIFHPKPHIFNRVQIK